MNLILNYMATMARFVKVPWFVYLASIFILFVCHLVFMYTFMPLVARILMVGALA